MLIQANADTPEEARAARAAGAAGIGLCRTEPMLLKKSRVKLMRAITTAADTVARDRCLRTLLPSHQADFEDLFREIVPLPVTIRLLDPPLRDFLPTLEELDANISEARLDEDWEELFDLSALRRRHGTNASVNPSMGHRGCRLSLTHPEILRMQIVAILEAAATVSAEGQQITPNILVPLVASEEEMVVLAQMIREAGADLARRRNVGLMYRLGALIELPRAAICAGPISDHVDFVAFGTNDLTQMTYGFSKHDTHAYLNAYLQQGIFKKDPFKSIDKQGVGHLMSVAVTAIRKRHPEMEIGACGDHSADADSLRFFQTLGMSYVSCAPEFVAVANELSAELTM